MMPQNIVSICLLLKYIYFLQYASSNHESPIQILAFLQLCKGDSGFESAVFSSATSLLLIEFYTNC